MAFKLITNGLTPEQMDKIHRIALEISSRERKPYLAVAIELYKEIREQKGI